MAAIVDSFEDEFIVLEIDGKMKDIPSNQVEETVAVGDVVVYEDGKWRCDHQATAKRKKEIQSLMDSVWED